MRRQGRVSSRNRIAINRHLIIDLLEHFSAKLEECLAVVEALHDRWHQQAEQQMQHRQQQVQVQQQQQQRLLLAEEAFKRLRQSQTANKLRPASNLRPHQLLRYSCHVAFSFSHLLFFHFFI